MRLANSAERAISGDRDRLENIGQPIGGFFTQQLDVYMANYAAQIKRGLVRNRDAVGKDSSTSSRCY